MRRLTLVLSVGIIFSFYGRGFIQAQIPAFPGAEGAGRYTRGGRGGVVYEVTNLNDDGPGSLREAVEAYGPRTVVFRISGTIQLESDLDIKNAYITIAGQTAPGDGICIRDYQVQVKAIEVIIRYLRFRLGDETGEDTDSIWGRNLRKIIIDHCSASWSVDEAMSFYGIDSLTVQWCLISESLYLSNHPKGAHGYGGIWGGRDASFHHNLFAHHSSRTPRFAGNETPRCVNVDFRNNVIYNWGFNSAYGGEGGQINMVANYYKAGPATKNSVMNRIVQPYDMNGKWYIEENVVEGYPAITEDNWAGGVQGGYDAEAKIRAHEPFPAVPVVTQSAEEAYALVLENAGDNFPVRDEVDERVVYEVQTGTASYDGTAYEIQHNFTDTEVNRGIIDSQNDVGGWPVLCSAEAPVDSDHDGMPDPWESAHGLNENDPSDRNVVDSDGYTMLEVYINSLVEDNHSSIMYANAEPLVFQPMRHYPNPFNAQTTISYSVPESGWVDMKIIDIRGRIVRQLIQGIRPAGHAAVVWDGMTDGYRPAATGLYLCILNCHHHTSTLKMQLIR